MLITSVVEELTQTYTTRAHFLLAWLNFSIPIEKELLHNDNSKSEKTNFNVFLWPRDNQHRKHVSHKSESLNVWYGSLFTLCSE